MKKTFIAYSIKFPRLLFCITIILIHINISISQTVYPKSYFRSPLDIPLKLAANFGDIRPNHFHAGLDIETEQSEGFKVYAVADGYVSRIKVSATGYGNALYITHPNGFTTVYGHLQRYPDAIAAYIKKNQYEKESFEIDLALTPDLFPLKKSDIVAFSGNTGGSEGPHLHFEIRDSKTEEPVDPLLFGFDIPDYSAPVINALKVYPLYHSGTINNKPLQQRFAVINKTSNSYQLTDNSIINVQGNIGFSVEGFDKEDNNDEHFTICSLELFMDGNSIFNATINKFAFYEQRCVNAHIDYEQMKKTNEHFLKVFKEPNDRFNTYKASGSGVLNIHDIIIHYIKIIARDAYGNASELNFKIKNYPNNSTPNETLKPNHYDKVFPFQIANSFDTDDARIYFPDSILYDTLLFNYSTAKGTLKTYSDIHHIHYIYTPIHAAYSLSLKCHNLQKNLEDKALLVHLDAKGNAGAIKSVFKDGWITANPTVLGDFAVMADTVPPIITLLTDLGKIAMNQPLAIKFRITDNLSGIKAVKATINGHWILMIEDAKTQTFTCKFDKASEFLNSDFYLEVLDVKGNKTTYKRKNSAINQK